MKKYKLEKYQEILNEQDLIISSNLADFEISHLEVNSKAVKDGTLFICKGHHFKKEYLLEAIKDGAVAYVSEIDYEVDLPNIIVQDIDQAMAYLAKLFYNDPQSKLKIIAVGGTKGKTTTTHYIKSLLDLNLESLGKKPAGIISSIEIFDGLNTIESINTTPISVDLNRYLYEMQNNGLEYVVMESSSQAFKYHRSLGIDFEVSVFLNIDEDHISPVEHSDYNDYLTSKLMMFKQSKKVLINKNTKDYDLVYKTAILHAEVSTFALDRKDVDYYAYDLVPEGFHTEFKVKSNNIDGEFNLGMFGKFNVENALAAISVIDLLGFTQDKTTEALEDIYVSGRTVILKNKDESVVALADYAHNRLSFSTLIKSIIEVYPEHEIRAVFGAPGGKAFGRREEMASIADEYADIIYLTAEDPGYESVRDIAIDVAKYIKNTPYKIEEDRTKAIQKAFENLNRKTIILVVGKGEDTMMYVQGEYVSMPTDADVIKECLKQFD